MKQLKNAVILILKIRVFVTNATSFESSSYYIDDDDRDNDLCTIIFTLIISNQCNWLSIVWFSGEIINDTLFQECRWW